MTIYRSAKESDITLCTSIFEEGFAEQLSVFFGPRIPVELLSDFLRAGMHLEDGGFIVAEEGVAIAGFIIVSKKAGKLFYGFLRFYFFRMVFRVIKREYRNISFYRIFFPLLQFFLFNLQGLRYHINSAGQVFILAVASSFRGKGIGKILLRKGLEFLKKNSINSVKLEVRSNNDVARNLYLREGFVVKGKIRAVSGISLIMTRDL